MESIGGTLVQSSPQFFLDNKCLDLIAVAVNTVLECLSCIPGTYSSGGFCPPCSQSGCIDCSSGISCDNCANGLFPFLGSCQPCFPGCKNCTASRFDQCQSCDDGFFWRPNEYDVKGSCAPCHVHCKTCFGPGATDCNDVAAGRYWIDYRSPLNATAPCHEACVTCTESATRCTSCHRLTDLVDFILDVDSGTCLSTDNSASEFGDCMAIELRGGVRSCVQCAALKYWNVKTLKCEPNLPAFSCKTSAINSEVLDSK